MTQLGRDGLITKEMFFINVFLKERRVCCELFRVFIFLFLLEQPRATATLIRVNYFSSRSSARARLVSFGIRPSLPEVLHCINLQREPQLKTTYKFTLLSTRELTLFCC